MSRGIKDLRDLICVSRLTVRHSDDEIFSSDDELSQRLGGISVSSVSSADPSRESSAASQRNVYSPDSGIATNGNSPQESTENVGHKSTFIPKPPSQNNNSDIPRSFRKKKKKKKKSLKLETLRHELPKPAPLPPVTSWTHSRPSSSSSESSRSDLVSSSNSKFISLKDNKKPVVPDTNFDEMLTYLDATLVSEWLHTSNKNVTDMATWCHAGENFVQFAHFWLSQFPDIQKQEFFKLEHSIIVDNLDFAFAAGRQNGLFKHRDIVRFVKAVFREYPEKLLSLKGMYLFLDYLDILSSERQDSYKTLLSDVKCSTRVKQHAQWVLAVRSFALVSVWISVLNFYRRLVTDSGHVGQMAEPVSLSNINKNDPYQVRMYQAIRNGYTDVVQYLIKSNKINPKSKDLHNKSLLFTAVMLNQPKVLKFLLTSIKPCPNVNEAADTGNTPLHAAANNGNTEIVEILLAAKGININSLNPQCEEATPLHLAVMHGHTKVAEQLLKAGADVTLTMGDLTVNAIANDFGHEKIADLLKSHSS